MKIHLRTLQEKDAAGMLEWQKEPSIMCFFRFDASSATIDTCRDYIARANREPNARHYAIADENDEYLGTISLKNIDGESAEYAISTRKCAHGTGAAMQATKFLLEIAFRELKLSMVYLNVLAENGRANAFYRKAGFSFKSVEHDAIEIRGEKKDLNWYIMENKSFSEYADE